MPSSREVQEHRRKTISEILVEMDIRNQQELLEELQKRGITATQSSISRDLSELGAIRMNGVYNLFREPWGNEDEFRQVLEFVREFRTAGASITFLKTDPGAGLLVARAIDSGKWPEVLGTVAGPDSVLILTDERKDDQSRLGERFRRLLEEAH